MWRKLGRGGEDRRKIIEKDKGRKKNCLREGEKERVRESVKGRESKKQRGMREMMKGTRASK